jgi:hypothetical protein
MYILGAILIVIGMVLLKAHLSYIQEATFVDGKDPNKQVIIYVRGIGRIQYYKAVQTITDKMPRIFKSTTRIDVAKFLNQCMFKEHPTEHMAKIISEIDKIIDNIQNGKKP